MPRRTYVEKLIRMLRYILERNGEVTEDELIQEFGKDDFTIFSRMCLGGVDSYVTQSISAKGPTKYDLTRNGFAYLLKLEQDYHNAMMTRVSIQGSLGAGLLALAGMLLQNGTPTTSFQTAIRALSVGFLIILGTIFIAGAINVFFGLRGESYLKRTKTSGSLTTIHRCAIIAGIVALSFLIISSSLLIFLPSNEGATEGFWVTISGNVYANTSEKDDQVYFIYPDYVYDNMARIHQGADYIETAQITWDGSVGKYSASFRLPIAMNLIVTPNFEGCAHQRIWISPEKPAFNLDLNYTSEVCYNEQPLPADVVSIIDRTRTQLDGLDQTKDRMDASSVLKANLKKHVEESRQYIQEYTEAAKGQDTTAAERAALLAWWHKENSYYDIGLYDTEQCLIDVQPAIIANDSCMIIPLQSKQDVQDANRTFTYRYAQREERLPTDWNTTEIRQDIARVNVNQNEIRDRYQECERAKLVIKASIDDQETQCSIRQTYLAINRWSERLLWLFIGLIIGSLLAKRIKEMTQTT